MNFLSAKYIYNEILSSTQQESAILWRCMGQLLYI